MYQQSIALVYVPNHGQWEFQSYTIPLSYNMDEVLHAFVLDGSISSYSLIGEEMYVGSNHTGCRYIVDLFSPHPIPINKMEQIVDSLYNL